MLGLVLAALGAGQGAAGAIEANQERQRQKGVIGRAFDIADKRQLIQQRDVRQQQGENLVARGLTGGGGVSTEAPAYMGTPTKAEVLNRTRALFSKALGAGAAPATGPAAPPVGVPHTLGAQVTSDLGKEQQLEQQDLNAQREAALSGVNAAANAAEVGSIASGIQSGISGWASGTGWGGIDPVNPISTPKGTVEDFNVNGGPYG